MYVCAYILCMAYSHIQLKYLQVSTWKTNIDVCVCQVQCLRILQATFALVSNFPVHCPLLSGPACWEIDDEIWWRKPTNSIYKEVVGEKHVLRWDKYREVRFCRAVRDARKMMTSEMALYQGVCQAQNAAAPNRNHIKQWVGGRPWEQWGSPPAHPLCYVKILSMTVVCICSIWSTNPPDEKVMCVEKRQRTKQQNWTNKSWAQLKLATLVLQADAARIPACECVGLYVAYCTMLYT